MSTARLSALRSWPNSAQDGQRPTYPADFSYFADVIQNPELRSPCPTSTLHSRLGLHSSLTRRDRRFFAADEYLQFLFCQFA